MISFGSNRINLGLQTTKFSLKLKNQMNLLQKIGNSSLNIKKQKFWGRVNVATARKQIIQAVVKQSEIDDKVDADKIVRGGIEGANVTVVGGGPAGLAAALMLAKQGYNNITVLEALSREEYFDISRSYPYGINYRGQSCLQKLDVLERLKEVGVDQAKTQTVMILPNGTTQTTPSTYSNTNVLPSYLVQRQELSKILLDKIENNYNNSITFHFNAKCTEIKHEKNQQLKLTYQIKDENPISISPYLVIGADGKNSFIRNSLHEITNQKKFKLIKKPVFGTGTAVKIIKVPLNFYLDNNKQQLAENEKRYQIIGLNEDDKDRVFILSYSPSKILTQRQSRTFSLNFHNQDHNIFKIQDREEILNYLEKQVPQLPIRNIITSEEADNFLRRGIKHPLGGYTENLSYNIQQKNTNYISTNNNNNNICKGIILIGDAIHHFPPFIGQGVNAALEDVSILHDLFQKYDSNLEIIMHEYESTRKIDSKALLQLTQQNFARPPTNWFNDNMYKYGRTVKTFLHQKVPKIFPPPPVNYLFRSELRYSEIIQLINSSDLLYNFYFFMLLNTCLFGVIYLQRYFAR